MRVGIVILPIYQWNQARGLWVRAEEGGFDSAWMYDHLSYRTFRERPWFGALPTLAAAAVVTERIRLGTMVTNANFRHPVPLAKDVLALDNVSGGRFTLGVGSGTAGFDATALGQEPWSVRERVERFEDFVELTDRLLTEPATVYEGRFYSAGDVRMIPGCVQVPRVPFAIAGRGPRGMRLAARYGQSWVTCPESYLTPERCRQAVAAQLTRLGDICAEEGRDGKKLGRILLTGYTTERPRDSVDAFVDMAGRYAELGITEIVVHQPVVDSVFSSDPAVFERIIEDGLPQVKHL